MVNLSLFVRTVRLPCVIVCGLLVFSLSAKNAFAATAAEVDLPVPEVPSLQTLHGMFCAGPGIC